MKKIHYAGVALCGLCLATSCVDDKYDLSDIDTTTAIKLDNLVVPVNLETITLDEVLDIDDNDLIVKFPEGASPQNQYYAIRTDGSFEADEVYVDYITALDDVTVNPISIPVVNGEISNLYTHFSYLVHNVDPALVSLNYLGMDNSPMMINFNITSDNGDVTLKDLVLSIPTEFEANYNGRVVVDGKVYVGDFKGSLPSPIYVAAMNYGEGGLQPVNGTLDIAGDDLGITSATVVSNGSASIKAQFTMSGFTANQVSGKINYAVETPEIEPVSLSGLPDFLKDGDTNLVLTNPQLYLDFGNPLGVPFYTTLDITPKGNGGSQIYEPLVPFNSTLILAAENSNLALTNEYTGAEIQTAPSLKNILAGKGLPESIEFNLEDTRLEGQVLNLELGTYMGMAGRYTFFSPLAFDQGSEIIYQKSETDFFGDDVKEVKVTQLVLSAYPVSNIPFDVELTVYPLDKRGMRIIDSNNNVVSATGYVKAYANGNDILELNINQSFTGLDGVEYVVKVNNLNGESLKPDQNITLNHIRAKLSGEYVTKL